MKEKINPSWYKSLPKKTWDQYQDPAHGIIFEDGLETYLNELRLGIKPDPNPFRNLGKPKPHA